VKYYLIRKPKSVRSLDLPLKRKWGLPGVQCYVCGATWAATGQIYPAVSLSSLDNSLDYAEPRVVPLDEFQRLRESLSPVLPAGLWPLPGCQFGPLSGEIPSHLEGIVWFVPWIILISHELEIPFRRSFPTVPLVPVEAPPKHTRPDPLFELHIEAKGYLIAELGSRSIEPCRGCGRRAFSRSSTYSLVLDQATLPSDSDFFRILDLPTNIVCNDRFKDFCEFSVACQP
jgi:uncharacterized double-CXXCG motif protein